jgi:hypothetical protein
MRKRPFPSVKRWVFAALFAACSISPALAGPNDCVRNELGRTLGTQRYENLFDQVAPVIDVSKEVPEVAVKDLKAFTITDLFRGENDVFIGFGKPNVYLVVPNGIGPDGKPLFLRYAAKSLKRGPSVIEQAHRAQSGVLFHFPDLPPETVEDLRQAMRKHEGSRQWTCANSVCRVLQDAGFSSGKKPLDEKYMPHTILTEFVRDGFSVNGQPVKYDIIRTTPIELESFNLEILKSELSTPYRHASRAWVGSNLQKKFATFWAFPKTKKPTSVTLEVAQIDRATEPEALSQEALSKLPGQQIEVSDLDFKISRPSKLGVLLRTAWGSHQLFQVQQSRVPVDKFLPETLTAYPQQNPGLMTRLKKNFLFSKPVVSRLRAGLASEFQDLGKKGERHLHDLLQTHTDANPNKYNIVITGKGVTVARVQVRHKFVDWILTKHVLISGYDPDVRFAGEIWKDEHGVIHLNNDSGTYRPTPEQLQRAKEYLEAVFPNTPFVIH